jgi:hypothetical protein
MKNVRVAFEEYDGDVKDLVGYKKLNCHMIFDIKMGENFRRKARLVADGHKTATPSTITYSSVVSRDRVRIALTVAALNDLKILACDILNAYLTAPCRQAVAAGTIRVAKQGTEKNLADLFTKVLTVARRNFLLERFTY